MKIIKTTTIPAAPVEGGDAKRVQSGVSYPYFDLDASVKVAEVLHSKGGGSGTADQLAFWLGYKSVKSGTFLTRVAAAKNFGLIQSGSGRFTVTDRAMTIIAPVMPEDAVAGKTEAFLAVELFAKVFEQFRGKTLPPEVGLKNLFKSAPYFILTDRVDPAVRVFLGSAEQAGLLTPDRSRLIVPSTGPAPIAAPSKAEADAPAAEKPKAGGGGGGDGPAGVHSAIVGLLRELPPPGAPWSAQKKARFLSAFQATIDFIYPEEDPP